MGRPRVGLALGGGGARGLAHIGVLQVLEQENIPVDLIAGTSIGALVGAVYALNPDTRALEARVARFLQSEAYHESGLERFRKREPAENVFGQVAKYVRDRVVINLAHSRSSIVGTSRFRKVIENVLDNATFEATRIPLSIVSTDLITGEDVLFNTGSIREAALASAAIPGFLPPVKNNGSVLVDGAVTSPVPIAAARRMGAQIIIAVDVGQDLGETKDDFTIIDVMFRTNAITSIKLKELTLAQADVVIRPEVGEIHWADFSQFKVLIGAGALAATRALPKIRRVLNTRRTPLWRKILGSKM